LEEGKKEGYAKVSACRASIIIQCGEKGEEVRVHSYVEGQGQPKKKKKGDPV